jgi:hypothetical protein
LEGVAAGRGLGYGAAPTTAPLVATGPFMLFSQTGWEWCSSALLLILMIAPDAAKARHLTLSARTQAMIAVIKTFIVSSWNFIFDHSVSPLRHIPDIAVRHYVLQALGLMWAVSFSVAIESYTFLAASILGHAFLISAAAVTVATFTVAAKRPKLFMRGAGRRRDGEHD